MIPSSKSKESAWQVFLPSVSFSHRCPPATQCLCPQATRVLTCLCVPPETSVLREAITGLVSIFSPSFWNASVFYMFCTLRSFFYCPKYSLCGGVIVQVAPSAGRFRSFLIFSCYKRSCKEESWPRVFSYVYRWSRGGIAGQREGALLIFIDNIKW